MIELTGPAFKRIFIVMILASLILPAYAMINGSGNGPGEPSRKAWMDLGIGSIKFYHAFGNYTYPNSTLNIIVAIGHDDDPYESQTPVTSVTGMSINLSIEDGHGYKHNMSKPIDSVTLDRYIGDNTSRYAPLNITFQWTAPLDPPTGLDWEDFSYNATAELVIDDDDATDNVMRTQFNISLPESNPRLLDPDTGMRADEIAHWVDRGGSTSIPIMVLNDCSYFDYLDVDVIGMPEGWAVGDIQGSYYTPGSNITEHLSLVISNIPNQTLADMTHYITLQVRSRYHNETHTYPTNNTYMLRFKVGYSPNAKVYPSKPQVYLPPGESSIVYFILENTGNFEDKYSLSANIDKVHLDNGWKVNFWGGTGILNKVQPGESRNIKISVFVPENSPIGYNVYLTLNVTSSGPVIFSTVSGPCILFADRSYGIDLEEIDDPFEIYPGIEETISVNVTNTGNDRESNVTFLVSYKPKGWLVFPDLSDFWDKGGLDPGEKRTLNIIVYSYKYTASSERSAIPFIILQVKGGPYYTTLDEARYHFSIPLIRNFSATGIQLNSTAGPGEEVDFTIDVKNEGNWLDSPSFNLPFSWMYITPVLELAPSENGTIHIRGIVPFDLNADSNTSTPYPDDNGFFDPYLLTVWVGSQNNTYYNASVNISLTIVPFEDFTVEHMDEITLPLSYDQYRVIPIEIRNTGNCFTIIDMGIDPISDELETMISLQILDVEVHFNSTEKNFVVINYQEGGVFDEGEVDIVIKYASTDPSTNETTTLTSNITIDFVHVPFTLDSFGLKDVDEISNSSYTVTKGWNYTLTAGLWMFGDLFFMDSRIDFFDLVLYRDDTEIERVTVTSDTATLGTFNITFDNVTFDHDERLNYTVKIEGAKDDMGNLTWEKTITVGTFDPDADDDDDDDDDSVISENGIMLFIVIVFASLMIVLGALILISSRKQKLEEEE